MVDNDMKRAKDSMVVFSFGTHTICLAHSFILLRKLAMKQGVASSFLFLPRFYNLKLSSFGFQMSGMEVFHLDVQSKVYTLFLGVTNQGVITRF